MSRLDLKHVLELNKLHFCIGCLDLEILCAKRLR